MKALLFLLTLFAALMLWKRGQRPSVRPPRAPAAPEAQGASNAQSQARPKAQPMICCACCGIHLPDTAACFDTQGRGFCSQAHLRQMQGAGTPLDHLDGAEQVRSS